MTATRVLAALVLSTLPPAPAQAQDLASRTKGSADAPVTVYEMSDFQCPYCRDFWKSTFPAVEREYIATGKVKWIFINFPITQLHPNAVPAAEFAMCAARQGAFWKAHDILYEEQDHWKDLADTGPYLAGRVGELGVDRARMLGCLERSETLGAIRSDAEGAARSGARSTPTFYIEGGIMSGAYPIQVFRQVLDSVVAAKTR
ncbi:MAG TPA: thioredoxin domain-containing protein [Gemmatimonadales bacterium]|nr:thioredoxin domain-containing protein [Gemmatimonadales bacterium]